MNYEQWNDTIAAWFFRDDRCGEAVYLNLTFTVLQRLAPPEILNPQTDFFEAIKKGPDAFAKLNGSICRQAHRCFLSWKFPNSFDLPPVATKFPPFIAYLAMFSHAATLYENDFAANEYYGRLRQALNTPGTGMFPNFDETKILWVELCRWSSQITNGKLGILNYVANEALPYVTMPRVQVVLTDEERAALNRFFEASDFDPVAPPSKAVLSRALLRCPGLRTRTIQTLSGLGSELKAVLLGIVLAELRQPTHSLQDGVTKPGDQGRSLTAGLRICLQPVNEAGQHLDAVLRLASSRPLPEEELALTTPDGNVWRCQADDPNWSSTLYDSSYNVVPAKMLDWQNGVRLLDAHREWNAVLRPAPDRVRVFARGFFNDWAEVHKLPSAQPFFAAFHDSQSTCVQEWGSADCDGFRIINVTEGPPLHWHLCYAERARVSHPKVDVLQLEQTPTFDIAGGIKTGHGSQYFTFAPPEIVIEGTDGTEYIAYKGKRLEQEQNHWRFPSPMPVDDVEVTIVICGNTWKRHLSFREPVLDPHLETNTQIRGFDRFGQSHPPGSALYSKASVSGALLQGFDPLPCPPIIPTHFAGRITYLGPIPGQYACWPEDQLPTNWVPDFALYKVHKDVYHAQYVGDEGSAGLSNKPATTPRQRKDWKQAIRRKRVEVQGPKRLRDLWRQYRNAAEKI